MKNTPSPLHRQKEFMPFRTLSLGTFSQNTSKVQIALSVFLILGLGGDRIEARQVWLLLKLLPF